MFIYDTIKLKELRIKRIMWKMQFHHYLWHNEGGGMETNMERTIVIYKSKYGATDKYAAWIGEELDCPVVELGSFDKKMIDDYYAYLKAFLCLLKNINK